MQIYIKSKKNPKQSIKTKLPYSNIFFKVVLEEDFFLTLLLRYAVIKIIKLIPKLINNALKNPI